MRQCFFTGADHCSNSIPIRKARGREADNEQVVNHGIGVDEPARVYVLRSMQVQGSPRRGASATVIVATTI